MSGAVRAGLVFGLATVGAVVGAQLLGLVIPIPCIGLLSVIALGLGAGYTAAKATNATRDQRLGRGLTAGAIAGLIALVLGGLAIFLITLLPFYQDAIQAGIQAGLAEQSQELEDAGIDPTQFASLLSGGAGLVGGICGGLINFFILLITAPLGALFWKGATGAGYVPAGGSPYTPPSGNYIPNQTGEGGARVYDPNDPNRPQ